MALVEYSSSSESEEECNELPAASTLLQSKEKFEETHSNHNEHEGRIRSFPHVRGNWATHVYIPINCDIIEQLRFYCQQHISLDLRPTEDLHVSLSRTVILLHHFIDSFVKSLQINVEKCSSFWTIFNEFAVYTNDEKTRTFIAWKINGPFLDNLQLLTHQVDTVMSEFKLPVFYEEASFHMSFLWCLGDHLEEIKRALKKINLADYQTLSIKSEKVHCRLGNKTYEFRLK